MPEHSKAWFTQLIMARLAIGSSYTLACVKEYHENK